MFAAISAIATVVADFLSSSAMPHPSEPGCYGRTYRGTSAAVMPVRETLRSYRDERDLARQLAALDDEFDPSRLTIVVVLDERTRQTFSAGTIRRTEPALRLAITTTFGAGPARDFVGDLTARARSLGWQQIVCDRNCDRAVRESRETTQEGETCVVFLPR